MKKIFILVFFTSLVANSQVGGETIYNFLNVPTSARQAALGGKTLTILDDVNQPLWNPATINEASNEQLSINYLNFLSGINYGSMAYSHEINPKFGSLSFGLIYANYGDFIEAEEDGTEVGNFKAYDLAFSVGYAYDIEHTNISVGANLKVINSVIYDYSSTGIAVDIGAIYKSKDSSFVAALTARNFGTQITVYDEVREDLPFEVAIGVSKILEHVPLKVYATLDNLQKWSVAKPNPSNSTSTIDGETSEENISEFENAMRHLILGIELFPEKGFNLRLGYNYRRAKELQLSEVRTLAGFSAGFGLKMGRFKLNYGYTKYHPAENTSTFSLLMNFN